MAIEIDTSTRVCGLLGYPIGHSISPLIHNELASRYQNNLVYIPLQVEPGKLQMAIEGAAAWKFLGMNVTHPYKQEVIQYIQEIDPLAKEIGAVNTLVQSDKGYKGYNTDAPGLYRAMQDDHVVVENAEVLLLGSGGVARAVAYIMLTKKARNLTILNRSLEKAQSLANEINHYAGNSFAKAMQLADYKKLTGNDYLAIQATNIGMFPAVDNVVIENPSFYERISVGYDMIFNPLETLFMKKIKESGGKAYNGLKMLLFQGIIAYEYWNHIKVEQHDAEEIYQLMLKKLKMKNEMVGDKNG